MKKIILSLVAVSIVSQPVVLVAAARSSAVVVADEARSTGFSRARFLYQQVKELPEAPLVVAFSKVESSQDLKNTFSSSRKHEVAIKSIIPAIKNLVAIITTSVADLAKSVDKTRTVTFRIELSDCAENVVVSLKFAKNAGASKAARMTVEVTTSGFAAEMPEYVLNMLKALLLDDSWMQKNGMTCVGVSLLAALAVVGTGLVVRNNRLSTQEELVDFDGMAQKFVETKADSSTLSYCGLDESSLKDGVGIDLKEDGLLGPVPVTKLAYTDELKTKKVVAVTVFYPGQLEKLAPSLRWAFNSEQERYLFVPRQFVASADAFKAIANDLNYGRWHVVIVDFAQETKTRFQPDAFVALHNVSFAYRAAKVDGHSDLWPCFDSGRVGFFPSGCMQKTYDCASPFRSKLDTVDAFFDGLVSFLNGDRTGSAIPERDCHASECVEGIKALGSGFGSGFGSAARPVVHEFRNLTFLRCYDEAMIDAAESFTGAVCVDLADTLAVAAVKRNVTKFNYAVLLFFDSRVNSGIPGYKAFFLENTFIGDLVSQGFKDFVLTGPCWAIDALSKNAFILVQDGKMGVSKSWDADHSEIVEKIRELKRRSFLVDSGAFEATLPAAYGSSGTSGDGAASGWSGGQSLPSRRSGLVRGSNFEPTVMPYFNLNKFHKSVELAVSDSYDVGFVVTYDGGFKLSKAHNAHTDYARGHYMCVMGVPAFAQIKVYDSQQVFDESFKGFGPHGHADLPTITIILGEQVESKVNYTVVRPNKKKLTTQQKRAFDLITDDVLKKAVVAGYTEVEDEG